MAVATASEEFGWMEDLIDHMINNGFAGSPMTHSNHRRIRTSRRLCYRVYRVDLVAL